MAAMFIQPQSNGKDQPQVNHTLEDVAEEMLNGIFCHYEPPDPSRIEGAVNKKRRGILRAPKVFRRKSKKNSPAKSVRWSDTQEEEEEERKKALAAQKRFPVEIHCNLANTCSDVGVEAGCISPNTETYVFDEDKGFSKKQRDEDEEDIRQLRSGSDATEDEDDDLTPPPPPPYPKSAQKKSTLKSSSTSPTNSSKKKSKKEREVVFDDDGNPVSKRGKARLPPSAPQPSTKEKYMPELAGVKINLKEDEEHLAELARSSREGPPSKRYHRPRQEYDYEDVDDFNNSIVEENKRDKLEESDIRKTKNGLRRRSGSFEDGSETNTSTVSNTSSLFRRFLRRNPKSSSSSGGGSKDKKTAPGRSRSTSPARSSKKEQESVDVDRSSGRLSTFLRSMSPRSNAIADEADWDETVPIVRDDVKHTRSSDSRSRPLTRETEPTMRRARSRSADAKGDRSQSPGLSRTRSRSMDDAENRMRTTPRSSRPEGIDSYYHPAHPLYRSQMDDSMERQSLITAHRQGFDGASTATTSYSDAIERQSYITAHRQTHEGPRTQAMVRPISYSQQRDDMMERQSYITVHRQGFDPPPTIRQMPQYPIQYQQQYRLPLQPVAAQGRVTVPPGYYPYVQAPMPTRGRSTSPAPRGRSPSPSRAHAMMRQRSQSPAKARAGSPHRRRSFDPQYNYSHAQPPPQQFHGARMYAPPPAQQQMMVQRPMVTRQNPYPQYYTPSSGLPQVRPPGKISPQRPQPLHPGPRPQQMPTPGSQQLAGYRQQRSQPPQFQGAGEQALRPIPAVLPKSRSSLSTSTKSLADDASTLDTNKSYDPLSVHDPTSFCPPNFQPPSSNCHEQYFNTVDPVTAYGQQWNPNENRSCSVMEPIWEKKESCGSVANQNDHPVKDTMPPPEIETTMMETKQTQGEGTAEDNEAADTELTWEERTRQAWDRIRNGLIVFGEPKETECEALSPCAGASRMQLQDEPVILPERQSAQHDPESQQYPVYQQTSTAHSTEPVILPENRSLMHPQQPMQPQLYMLPQCGGGREVLQQQPSHPPGILKQPSYDRRVTFGEPTEQIFHDDIDEIRSYDSRMMPRRRRVFRGRKLLNSLFGGKATNNNNNNNNNKAGASAGNKFFNLPHLNTKSTEASSVSGSVSQEWEGSSTAGGGGGVGVGGVSNNSYYYAPQVEGSIDDPREPRAGDFALQRQYNPSCPGIYYQQ